MSYLVLARKYRPKTFDEVVGQDVVTNTLRGAITEGRIGHAYLFSGPRGTGGGPRSKGAHDVIC